MKRTLLLLAAVALLLSGCSDQMLEQMREETQLGAYGNQEQEQAATRIVRDYVSLVFYEDMDLHPLTATNSANHELLKLVYSAPVRVGSDLKPINVLAESVTVDGKTVTVVLKKGLKFSDGSAVTAADLVSSIKTVRNTETSPYHARLADVKSYRAEDGRTVIIKLERENVDFAACLDIPIVKKNKSHIGCGPYRFSEQSGERVLVPNTHYFTQPKIKTIYLKKPTDDRESKNMFSVGLLDVYFAAAESDVVFSGGKNYTVQSYAGDSMLYLGVNCNDPRLSDRAMRSLLNGMIDRTRLTEDVLLKQADASAYPFQPGWYKSTVKTSAPDEAALKAQAEKLGLTVSEKALMDQSGAQLAFSLLVAEGSTVHSDTAQAMVEGFALFGVRIQLESVSNQEYYRRLAAGEYQLYLGEIKTGRTLNTSLYAAESAANFSGTVFPTLEEAAAQYKNGEISVEQFAAVFDQYTPVMPLAYRRGVLYVAADVGPFAAAGPWSLYGDITKLTMKETELTK